MAISVFPTAVTSSSSINANSVTAASPNVLYEGRLTLEPAIYQITCASGTIANIQFLSSPNTVITSSVTSSGTVTLNLGNTVDRVRVWTNTGSNIVVTITKIANSLTNQFSGTLDTITASGTYTGTSTSGYAYAVLVGGGGGGGGGGQFNRGIGGASGGICGKIVTLTGSMEVVIGSGGLAGAPGGNATNAGASTFDGMTAGGGTGGLGNNYSTLTIGGTATGGTFNVTGGAGGSDSVNPTAAVSPYPFVINGSTGGGQYGGGGPLAGSGIGTGGTGASMNATGYGSGGSSAYDQYGGGGNGAPGVLYVLRF
jgi:hypothetical protein